jgi:hypothetical protein
MAESWLFSRSKGPENHGHLLGDVPALLIVALVLAILTPRGDPADTLRHAAVH